MSMTDVPRGYGQYCPIVRAVEVLGERWALLIVRDLIVGTTRFNDLARGLPGLSRSLLSRRLRQLQAAGIVDHRDGEYVLTDAGRELEPIVFGLSEWGARWAFGAPRDDELDPALLLWWAHSRVDRTALPDRRVVIAFALREPTFHGWLLVEAAGVSVCSTDPGFAADITVSTTVRTLSEVWSGRIELTRAMRDGRLAVTGQRDIVRRIATVLQLSPAAPDVQGAVASGHLSSVS